MAKYPEIISTDIAQFLEICFVYPGFMKVFNEGMR